MLPSESRVSMVMADDFTLSNAVEHARGCVATNTGLFDMIVCR